MKKLLVIVAIIVGGSILISLFEPAKVFNSSAQWTVKTLARIKYPKLEVQDVELRYQLWNTTNKVADDDHKAEYATVIVGNKKEEYTIDFHRSLLLWLITDEGPNYGPKVPNDLYYVDESSDNKIYKTEGGRIHK